MYYIYVLQSLKDMNFYTGFTKDLTLRFEQHKKGLVESTKHRRPIHLIYDEACLSKEDAIRREKYFKTYNGKIFLRRRLKSYLTVWKANRSRSKADFKNKIKICESEASETQYWLEVIVETKWLSRDEINLEYNECCELLALFKAIGKSK